MIRAWQPRGAAAAGTSSARSSRRVSSRGARSVSRRLRHGDRNSPRTLKLQARRSRGHLGGAELTPGGEPWGTVSRRLRHSDRDHARSSSEREQQPRAPRRRDARVHGACPKQVARRARQAFLQRTLTRIHAQTHTRSHNHTHKQRAHANSHSYAQKQGHAHAHTQTAHTHTHTATRARGRTSFTTGSA